MSLMNKVSIVTGGAQGLGKAIALDLARKGSHLVVGDVNLPRYCIKIFQNGHG
jgi:NAD(P)-dependent dehydrogenase (short-subunit alcohol dehydrogenase family)